MRRGRLTLCVTIPILGAVERSGIVTGIPLGLALDLFDAVY